MPRFTVALTLFVSLISQAEARGPASPPLRFLAFGDFGSGNASQAKVAGAMKAVCKKDGCDFAVGTGDNFYEWGVSSSDDPQFKSRFEDMYAGMDFPFYMVLGNHDQSGPIPGSGVHPEKGEFQIEYTKKSARWKMPSRYYRVALPQPEIQDESPGQPLIEFFAIDTNLLAPQNIPMHGWYKPGRAFDLKQRSWLKQSLTESRAVWKWVVGHHPYRNNGHQGNAGRFIGFGLARGKELKKMYEENACGLADFLLTGHDHSMQWLPPYKDCGPKTQFLISGAAAKENGPEEDDFSGRSNPAIYEKYHALGFFWIQVKPEAVTIRAYSVSKDGEPKLEFEKAVSKTENPINEATQ